MIDLGVRMWQSERVRGYALALHRATRTSPDSAEITRLLDSLEPLHEIREHDHGGVVLWIAFNWYCARLRDTTQAAIDAALRRWPGDEWLVEMRERARGVLMGA